MKPVALFALLALSLAAPAMAKDPAPEPTTAPATGQPSEQQTKPKKPEGEKKICRMEIVTGSIRSVRKCKTQSQIDVERAAGDATLEEMQRMTRNAH